MRCTSLLACVLLAGVSLVSSGELEPTAPPGATMKSLDEIPPTWSQKLDSTNGSAVPEIAGCDSSRFRCIWFSGAPTPLPQAVLDKETGLVWERSPDTVTLSWSTAVHYCYSRDTGGRLGWRLPKVEELMSLADPSESVPALPDGHPFLDIHAGATTDEYYWSSTTSHGFSTLAVSVGFRARSVSHESKTDSRHIWCVRGGHGYDGF